MYPVLERGGKRRGFLGEDLCYANRCSKIVQDWVVHGN